MNNDYKSALSKIHLDDMKKEQMKQLFKKKHMNKKNKIINRLWLPRRRWQLWWELLA